MVCVSFPACAEHGNNSHDMLMITLVVTLTLGTVYGENYDDVRNVLHSISVHTKSDKPRHPTHGF